jgi:uncharacterized protein (DUF427 family)
MSSRVRDTLMRELDHLRHEPTDKRVRAMIGDHVAVDSTRAMLVWEPRRVVPSYAVPAADVRGELLPAPPSDGPAGDEPRQELAGRRVLDPRIPFSVHTSPGRALSLRVDGETRAGVAYQPDDPDLEGRVVLDFGGFDAWYDEDEPVVSHPRDPFHRIDILRSSRHVRVERNGDVLAESRRALLLFETSLPVRFYFPREDVRATLHPSDKLTYCAYKGEASYWSPEAGGRPIPDLGWSYEAPLREATEVTGLVAFFNERVDLVLDGEPQERPITPWS